MSLISLIQQHAQAQAQDEQWSEVASVLNATTVAVRNPKQWTLGEIEQSLGADAACIIAKAIKDAAAVDPLMESAFVAVSTSGIQLHTDERQALVASIGQQAGWPAEQIAAMQALGLVRKSPADVAGLGVVTADQCRDDVVLQQKKQSLDAVQAALEIAAAEFRKAESTPQSILQAARSYIDELLP